MVNSTLLRGYKLTLRSSLYHSQREAEKRFEAWEPKTREEAQQRWKEMQSTPDHLTLLHMYKRAGVEPIKLAKYVSPPIPLVSHTHTGRPANTPPTESAT